MSEIETSVDSKTIRYRPVTVLDASAPKHLELSVQVPVEDMAALGKSESPAAPGSRSIWTSIHPELLALVRSHRSTLIFVNNRRLAERISGALNDLAGETLVLAHHGSVAPAQRKEIEERLKSGSIKGLVATSSLELGIDMGAIDLVVQIEAPPSVSSGMQRIGRAGHQVDAVSNGIIFPKFRADLLACAAATGAMQRAQVEAVRYPRNPLDVLAQQMVASIAMEPMSSGELFAIMRRAAPFAALSVASFESVLDLLSGRYPSDEFAELRPRITWDRATQRLTPRQSAQRIALVNGGTIPDRGLYGVFLAGAEKPTRLGELDEEMVFESKPGETIILGASTWRITEITHDRVLVSPAPGEPGKMPFWHGDGPGRPAEFGQQIGALARELFANARARGLHQAGRRSLARPQRGGKSSALSARSAGRHRPRSFRRRHPHRALSRRTRRLAHLRSFSLRQPRPRPLVHGRRSLSARRDWSCSRRPCGPTMASSSACRRATARRTPPHCCHRPTPSMTA